MSVFSIYVEKTPAYAAEAHGIWRDIKDALTLSSATGLRVIDRYLVQNLPSKIFQEAISTVFSNPQTDEAYMGVPRNAGEYIFAVEALASQFDQRADSCQNLLALLTEDEPPTVRYARLYAFTGSLTKEELEAIKKYIINPVEAHEVSLDIPSTLQRRQAIPAATPRLEGFIDMDKSGLASIKKSFGIAMDLDDLAYCWDYFTNTEKRDPTETEIRMIDTYWSDHCRHTTFLTHLQELTIEDAEINAAKKRYFALRDKLYPQGGRPITLMDMATIGAKALKAEGILTDLDESEEVNACSVHITVDVDGTDQDWLLMFKNETHNHPTEIEPFGGAATCLGGAIRDPLSGRSYVYQAMRITGAANPLAPIAETLEGKLPQRTLVQTAAKGYSSYGNQIGAATGHVTEIYHDNYAAKRMELGAVIAAVPADNVVRKVPEPGDLVLLLGGRTGRDGMGGATGSSQSHTEDSAEDNSSEVQKGNAPEERKIVRLFRQPEIAKKIKRSNDFGAGGVSVAIGELADGILIDLDKVPTKIKGLSGTEVAISESQERMAVVIAPEDLAFFLRAAYGENLEATQVAVITEEPRLVMHWQGDRIVDISREFLDSSGVSKAAKAHIPAVEPAQESLDLVDKRQLVKLLGSLDHCGQKGLVERFDSSAGGGTVLMPFGGKFQMTPAQSMVAKIPLEQGETNTASVMAWGFNPKTSTHSPYHGALNAVVDSVAKMVAAGGSRKKSWLTFQEYFERLGSDPVRWGKPAAALLGALTAQLELGIGAVGGKDSMSGSFEELDVPPTLVSFAVSIAKADQVISGEFKGVDNPVYLIAPQYTEMGTPEFNSLRSILDQVEDLLKAEKLLAIYTLGEGGSAAALPKMCFGNNIGLRVDKALTTKEQIGGFVFEAKEEIPALAEHRIGTTQQDYMLSLQGEEIALEELEQVWLGTLEPIFPTLTTRQGKEVVECYSFESSQVASPKKVVDTPRVVIPVLPGATGEYDLAKTFAAEGAEVQVKVLHTLTKQGLTQSLQELASAIDDCEILAIPHGMTGGGEPGGSGKFIAGLLRKPSIQKAVEDLLARDGLILGIGDGFHGLVQTGLLPFGEYRKPQDIPAALTHNTLGRFQSKIVRTRLSSNLSPWVSAHTVGDMFTLPLAGQDMRLYMTRQTIDAMAEDGQIACQYINIKTGQPTENIMYNPSGSILSVEAITSPDGRIYGCCALPERGMAQNIYKNALPSPALQLAKGAIDYFRK